MIEPTESESKEELDRFITALIQIRQEIREIEEGKMPKDNNLLQNAPHTQKVVPSLCPILDVTKHVTQRDSLPRAVGCAGGVR